MKLTQEQTRIATENLGFSAIGEDHEAQETLAEAFGDHTFFVNDSGLFAFVADEGEEGASESETARLVVVAAWADDDRKQLSPVEPPARVDVLFNLADGSITSGN